MNPSLAIEGELTVFTADEVKTRLLAAMSPEGHLDVDLGTVSEFDGAGLQLLLSARHESAQRGGALRLSSLSEQVRSVLRLTGLLEQVDPLNADEREVTP